MAASTIIVRTPLLAIFSSAAIKPGRTSIMSLPATAESSNQAAIVYPARLACPWIALRWRTTLSLSSPTFEAELVLV
ncbi:hypothetical protein ABIB07_004544 [Bradyrhizobium sp. RT10b]